MPLFMLLKRSLPSFGWVDMELRSVQEFLAAQSKWGVDADFVSTHTVSHHFVQHLSVSLLRV